MASAPMDPAAPIRLGQLDILFDIDISTSKYRDTTPPPPLRGALLHDGPAWRACWRRPLVLLTGLAALTFTGLTARANDNTVVSNLEHAETTSAVFIGYHAGLTKHYATAFTTGNAKYVLNSVKIRFAVKLNDPANFEVNLYTNSSGKPGTKIVQLSGNAPSTAGNHT